MATSRDAASAPVVVVTVIAVLFLFFLAERLSISNDDVAVLVDVRLLRGDLRRTTASRRGRRRVDAIFPKLKFGNGR